MPRSLVIKSVVGGWIRRLWSWEGLSVGERVAQVLERRAEFGDVYGDWTGLGSAFWACSSKAAISSISPRTAATR
jgi:hypothetical protein